MIKYLFGFVLLLAIDKLHAQNKLQPTNAFNFHSINQVGLLNGEKGTAFHLQTINGVQYKRIFAGIGVGLDYYQYRSFPVFVDTRYYFGKNNRGLFAFADGGLNYVWDKTPADYYKQTFNPKFYGGFGIGYAAGLKNGMAFLVNAGYSYKAVKMKQEFISYCPFNGPCDIGTENYNFQYNRLLFQVGWMF